jgi:hypothetical protein
VIPPLVGYTTEDEYRTHYEATYCNGPIITFDNIPVYFSESKFRHAFYESSRRDGQKDQFSHARASRIDWIAYALQNPNSERYQGWDRVKRRNDPTHRVAVVVNDYVVIIRLKKKRDGSLKADFVTCYVADNSIDQIRQNPEWDMGACLRAL